MLIRASLEAGETDNQTLILWCHLGNSDSQIASSSISNSSMSDRQPLQEECQEREQGQDPKLLHSSLSESEFNHVPQSSTDRVRSSRKHHLIRQPIAARNGSWLIFGSILTIGAVVLGISDPGLVRTSDLFQSLHKQLEKLIPKASPKDSFKASPTELPKVLPKGFPKESTKEIHSAISRNYYRY